MDIVEQLRAESRFRYSTRQDELAGLLHRAADEIERLRDEVHFKVGRNAPDTSKALEPTVREGTLQQEVLRIMHERRVYGWTDDELEAETRRTHQSVSAARNILMRKGLIEDSGQRRKTRSGNDAIVWRVR